MLYPYHETGHWLYFILQNHSFWLTDGSPNRVNHDYCQVDDSIYIINRDAYQTKCDIERFAEPLEQFTEAFAETHVQQFLYTNQTDYSDFERQGAEVDSVCEAVYWGTGPYFNYVGCNFCSVPPALPTRTRTCDDDIQPRCSDALMASENKYHQVGVIPQMTSLLMDLFDNVNAASYDDNDGLGSGMDTVFIPFQDYLACTMACTANVVVGDTPPNGTDVNDVANICESLKILQNCCASSMTGNLDQLRRLYFMTYPQLPTAVCP